MALPSPSRLSTLRPGQAIAAPTASGGPMPIEPPMFWSQSCGCAPRVAGKKPRPVRSEMEHLAAGAGDRRADRERRADADRAAHVLEPIVRMRAAGGREETPAGEI